MTEQTALRQLHRRFESMESEVEQAISDLRATYPPGSKARRVADRLETELEREIDDD